MTYIFAPLILRLTEPCTIAKFLYQTILNLFTITLYSTNSLKTHTFQCSLFPSLFSNFLCLSTLHSIIIVLLHFQKDLLRNIQSQKEKENKCKSVSMRANQTLRSYTQLFLLKLNTINLPELLFHVEMFLYKI